MSRTTVRIVLVSLSVALNGWPALERSGAASSFVVPARSETTPAAAIFRDELINPDSPQPMSHVASICELPDGRLAAAWYAGSREGAGDVSIYFATRSQTDDRWSAPRAIVTRESAARDLNRAIRKVGNALVFADSAGKLWLLYVSVSIGGWSGSSLNLTTSADQGSTWTPSRRLTLSPFFNLAELVKNGVAELSDGGWAVPIYHELAGTYPELLWLRESAGVIHATKSRMSAGWYGYQPALAPLNAREAVALLRDDSAARTLSVARSDDSGRTWSPPQILGLPNPDAGLDALRLHDGSLLLAFNDSTDNRGNLRLAVSTDQGESWTRIATLAEEQGGDFSYPFLIQARNGDVHLVYTWQRKAVKHVVFNAAWLDERRAASTR